ncbi:dihydrofolate reductase family protein [Streptomyces sp. NPDC058611]|uniref:dihydrofolate reductase family protein n=1 Tax=unclassified Streptomyces TaxID=2593676 RepID=UPI003646E078
MRQIILMMGVSLDGYTAGPDGEIDWHVVDDAVHRHANDEARGMGGFLQGRVTYGVMEDFWSTVGTEADTTADPDAELTADFAGIWRDTPKYVYSRTLRGVGANATIVRDVVPEEVAALKAAPGPDLLLGGARLAATFLAHDLVDAYSIYVHPVRIGRGVPLFPQLDGGPVPLRLKSTHTFDNGVVHLRYTRP